MGVQADIVAVFAMLLLAGVSMEHNAITGLTAQDMAKDAGIMRIRGIIVPYAITGDNFLRFVEDFLRDYSLVRALVKLSVIFDFADIQYILQYKMDISSLKSYTAVIAGFGHVFLTKISFFIQNLCHR